MSSMSDHTAAETDHAREHLAEDQNGVYIVSVRRETDRESMRVAAYQLVGFFDPTVGLPYSFLEAGYTEQDVIALIDGLHNLAIDPDGAARDNYAPFGGQGGSDSEDRPTDLYMFGLGGDGDANWLRCVEAAHAAWPTLLDTLGASVSGTLVLDTDVPAGEAPETRFLTLPKRRVPRTLRLKAGWDYDENGEQVHLPLEEAWDRFTAQIDLISERRGERYMDAKTMRKMRRHMVKSYTLRAREQRKAEAAGYARALADVMGAGVVAGVAVTVARHTLRRRA